MIWNMRQVYLDNNATTQVDPLVVESMVPHFLESYGNAASIHTLGQKARSAVEDGRQRVASLIGAQAREVVFTCGGTESDNTAVRGAAYGHRARGNHIITSTIEHPAVLKACEQLEQEGFRVTYIGVDWEGVIRMDRLEEAIGDDTILISIMHANNEVGAIQPLRAITSLTRKHDILFHTDAVQTVAKIPVDVNDLGIDLLSLSSHKIHGPKGVGALYVRQGVSIQPLMVGGSHERSRRAGTENVPGMVGLGMACQLAGEQQRDFLERVRGLRDRLEEGILARIPDVTVNGSRENRMPHVTNLSFRALEGESLLISLDIQGVAVSTGAACSSGSLESSHVLKAMNLGEGRTQGAIRLSLSRMNTTEDIDYVLDVLPPTVERMREIAVRR